MDGLSDPLSLEPYMAAAPGACDSIPHHHQPHLSGSMTHGHHLDPRARLGLGHGTLSGSVMAGGSQTMPHTSSSGLHNHLSQSTTTTQLVSSGSASGHGRADTTSHSHHKSKSNGKHKMVYFFNYEIFGKSRYHTLY